MVKIELGGSSGRVSEFSAPFELSSHTSPIQKMMRHFTELHALLKRHDETFELGHDPWFDNPVPLRTYLLGGSQVKSIVIWHPGAHYRFIELDVRPVPGSRGQHEFYLHSSLDGQSFYHADEELQARMRTIRAEFGFQRCTQDYPGL